MMLTIIYVVVDVILVCQGSATPLVLLRPLRVMMISCSGVVDVLLDYLFSLVIMLMALLMISCCHSQGSKPRGLLIPDRLD